MTGSEQIAAALSPAGTPRIPVVFCYTGIYERDHFSELTSLPWWQAEDPAPEPQAAVYAALTQATDIDWYDVRVGRPDEERRHIQLEHAPDGIYRVDTRSGVRRLLSPPVSGGTLHTSQEEAPVFTDLACFLAEAIPPVSPYRGLAPGQEDIARLLQVSLGRCKYPMMHVPSPLWWMGSILGYEQWFSLLATDPEPVVDACRRLLDQCVASVKMAAELGVKGIWIEECMTDQIGPARFARYNLPLLQALTAAIRAEGLHSIYYYCGDPWPVWEMLMASGADALSLEESKKGFGIDIEEVVAKVDGRMAVLGNLDAFNILERGSSDELRIEVERQLQAGRRNGSRFIMSIGSPVTPGTSVARVREYVALVRELG
ncbi:MAG: uroporphyrinogen decarboxylase family protein [Armatimonadota bacterium]